VIVMVLRWVVGFQTINVLKSVTTLVVYFGWLGGLVMLFFAIGFEVFLIYQRTNYGLYHRCML